MCSVSGTDQKKTVNELDRLAQCDTCNSCVTCVTITRVAVTAFPFDGKPAFNQQDAIAACPFSRYCLKPRPQTWDVDLSSKLLRVGESGEEKLCRNYGVPGQFPVTNNMSSVVDRSSRVSCYGIRELQMSPGRTFHVPGAFSLAVRTFHVPGLFLLVMGG